MMKTRWDNDMGNRTGVFYTKNNTELLWSIKQGVISNENQIRKQHNRLYRCGICFNDTKLLWLIRSGADFDEN